MLITGLAVAAALNAAPAEKPKPACEKLKVTPVAQRTPAPMQRLGELPQARHERTVLRMVEGCVRPDVVRWRVEDGGRR